MTKDTNGRPRFRLATLLGVVTVCSLVLGYLASRDITHDVSFHCFRVPSNDRELARWYQDQDGVEEVATIREGKVVVVHVCLAKGRGAFHREAIATPPLADLGYGVEAIGFGRPSLIGRNLQAIQAWASVVPVLAWLGIAASGTALLILKVVRIKGVTP